MKKTLLTVLSAITILSSCQTSEEEKIAKDIERINIEFAAKNRFRADEPYQVRYGNTIRQYIDFDDDGKVDEYKIFYEFADNDCYKDRLQQRHYILEGRQPVLDTEYKSHINPKLYTEFPSKEIRDRLSKEMNLLKTIQQKGFPKEVNEE